MGLSGAVTVVLAASVARGQTNYQAWNTPGTYLWLCPLGVTNVQAECWGGGGGGGGLNVTVLKGSGGGGAGGYARKNSMPVTPGQSYLITIPAAASGGDTNGSAGTNGSSVSFALAHKIPTIAQTNPNPLITNGNKIPLIPKCG